MMYRNPPACQTGGSILACERHKGATMLLPESALLKGHDRLSTASQRTQRRQYPLIQFHRVFWYGVEGAPGLG